MLRIDNLTYRIGARVLLDEADASINPGHRVGLVGRNGSGKTTLLRLISGELGLDGGRIDTPSRWPPYSRSSSNALASFRSGVSKPSVNQP